jgi:hypothetical protein
MGQNFCASSVVSCISEVRNAVCQASSFAFFSAGVELLVCAEIEIFNNNKKENTLQLMIVFFI